MFLQSLVNLQSMLKKVSQSPFHDQYKVTVCLFVCMCSSGCSDLLLQFQSNNTKVVLFIWVSHVPSQNLDSSGSNGNQFLNKQVRHPWNPEGFFIETTMSVL